MAPVVMVPSPAPINVLLSSYLTLDLSANTGYKGSKEVAQLCININVELCDQISRVKFSPTAKAHALEELRVKIGATSLVLLSDPDPR